MSEIQECKICMDIYGNKQSHIKAPKILGCGHTLCKECLEGIISKSIEPYILCPFCNSEINKQQRAEDYTTNLNIIDLVNESFNIPIEEFESQKGGKTPTEYKIISLGNAGVGKTSIFQRLLSDKFTDSYKATIGCDIIPRYNVKYKQNLYKLAFYDTGGQEKYMSTSINYIRQSDGILFVYDISNEESFDDLETWINICKDVKQNITGIILGNKSDKIRKVNYNEVKNYAEENGLLYYETSAKLDKNLKKAITVLLNEIIESKKINESFESLSSINTAFNLNNSLDSLTLPKKNLFSKFCSCINPFN